MIANSRPASFTRRALLKLGLALSGLLTLKGLLDYLGYHPRSNAPTAFQLNPPSSYPAGAAVHLPQARAWLLRDAAGFYAVSTVCPHLGCTVDRRPEGFLCPCHGSKFSEGGQVLNGPATRPLTFLLLTLSPDGRLVLHTDRAVPDHRRLAV